MKYDVIDGRRGLYLGGGRSYANVPAVPLTSSGFTITLWVRLVQQAIGYPEIFSDTSAPASFQFWFIRHMRAIRFLLQTTNGSFKTSVVR